MNKKFIFFGILAIALAIGYLIFGQLEKNVVYFLTPSELLAKGETAYQGPVRLGGMVEKGTIDWNPQITRLQFKLKDSKSSLSIVSNSLPPQMFQEEMGVVVEGRLEKTGHFLADRVMVKHSNEYHPPKEGEKPHILYKDLL